MSVGAKLTAGAVALLLAGWVSYRVEAPDASCAPTGPLGERVATVMGEWVHAAATEPAPTPRKVRKEVDGALGEVVDWAQAFQRAALGKSPKPARTPSGPPALTGGAEAARKAAAKYFPPSELRVAVAVAGAESNYRPDAVNRANRNGSVDHGLWQINSVHAELLRGRDWSDPNVNAWMAYQVWKGAGGEWTPWTTYNSGSYRKFLDGQGAEAPACEPVAPVQAPAVSPAGFDRLGNPRTVEKAVAWAERMATTQGPIVPRMCLHYMAEAYGWGYSGVSTAYQHWLRTPARFKGTGTPPRGALVYWRTPGPGHIALSLGGGKIATTDYPRGRIGIVDISVVDGWGPRLGWSAPVWPGRKSY